MSTATAVRPSAVDRAISAGNWPSRHPDGHPIAAVTHGWSHWVIQSSSRPSLDHHISMQLDGDLLCSCEAGTRSDAVCLHVAAVQLCMATGVWGSYCLCASHTSCAAPLPKTVRRAGQICAACAGLVNVADENARRLLAAEPVWCVRCASVKVSVAGEWCQGCVDYRKEAAAASIKPLPFRATKRSRAGGFAPAVAVAAPRVADRPRVTDCHRCETCGAIDPDPLHIAFCG